MEHTIQNARIGLRTYLDVLLLFCLVHRLNSEGIRRKLLNLAVLALLLLVRFCNNKTYRHSLPAFLQLPDGNIYGSAVAVHRYVYMAHILIIAQPKRMSVLCFCTENGE